MTEQNVLWNIVRRVLKQWYLILTVSISVSLLAGIVTSRMYKPMYQTQALIVVCGKWSSSGETYVAEDTVKSFREVINSNLLQKKVAEEMGLSSLPGTVSCSGISSTNMMNLTVRASSPENAITVMNGVLEHYGVVTEQLRWEVVLRVLEAPTVPNAPIVAYNESRVIASAFLGCVAILCAALFAFFYLRDDIGNEQQLEKKLDAKLFATIHHESINKGITSPFRKRKKTGLLITSPTVGFRYIETLQKMCTKLEYRTKAKDRKVIMITSVQENEGKSTVASNVALSLAKIGKRVVLVDLDLRKPAVFKLFELPYEKRQAQVGDVLSGRIPYQEALRTIEKSNLQILAGNRSFRNSAKLLNKEQVAPILEEIKADVDYVILDTPPLSLVADAEEVMRYADAGLLVVRQNVSLAKYINDAIDTFRSANCKLLGCVFNDVYSAAWGNKLFRYESYAYRYKYGYGRYNKEKTK